ncbi:MAG TPA: sigma 54-interacting transcriptional regulator [Planctomycetaceae bacterium]|jgi:DNA-binding NtrC family response regulator|nr:sigma 54-interacting transcriptional regulator [Planctomycetaceae bacterium]
MEQGSNVLVVDDEIQICRFVEAVLSARVAKFRWATRVRDALQILKSEPFDVLLTDLHLNGSNGLDLIQSSLRIQPDLAAIVITGFGTLDSAVEAMRHGVRDYVVKPINSQHLLAALDRALSEKPVKRRPDRPTEGTSPLLSLCDDVMVSWQMRAVFKDAEQFAQSSLPLCIEGEAGVGKQLIARWIHRRDALADASFIRFACAELQEARPGSEPVHWRKSVQATAASQRSMPRCTLYFDQIAELPFWAQRQLLEMIEGICISAATARDPNGLAVRVIAATDISLDAAHADGRLYRGLYDALRLIRLSIAPLRERPDDIRAIVHHFLERFCRAQNRDPGTFRRMVTEKTWQAVLQFDWPGNVGELANVVAIALSINDGNDFDRILQRYTSVHTSLPTCETIEVPLSGNLRSIEGHVVREIVRRHGGNKAAAARALGMHRRTLYRVLQHDKAMDRRKAMR